MYILNNFTGRFHFIGPRKQVSTSKNIKSNTIKYWEKNVYLTNVSSAQWTVNFSKADWCLVTAIKDFYTEDFVIKRSPLSANIDPHAACARYANRSCRQRNIRKRGITWDWTRPSVRVFFRNICRAYSAYILERIAHYYLLYNMDFG